MVHSAGAAAGGALDLLAVSGVYFSIVKMILLLIWLGSGFYAQRIWVRISDSCERHLPLLRIVALCAGPLVFLAWGVRKLLEKQLAVYRQHALRQAEKKSVKIFDHTGVQLNKAASGERSAEAQYLMCRLQFLLEAALEGDCRELTLEPEDGKYSVRLKGREALKKLPPVANKDASKLIQMLKSASGADPYEIQKPQQGSFRAEQFGKSFAIGFSSVSMTGGERISLTVKEAETVPKELAHSGMDVENQAFLRQLVTEGRGVILAAGPEGAGKKTLLSMLLNEVDRSRKDACWIGDGTEPELPGVAKLATNAGNMMTGEALLGSGVVQNMDVVAISNIDSAQTLKKAFQMASGGVLVIAGVTAQDAPAALEKLIGCGLTLQQLSVLRAVVGLRVLRRLCPECAVPAPLPAAYQDYFQQCSFSAEKLKAASGCRSCERTGYQGKTGVYDVIPFEEFLNRQTAAGTAVASLPAMLRQEGRSCEMLGYRSLAAAAAGVTSLDEVQNVVFKKEQI